MSKFEFSTQNSPDECYREIRYMLADAIKGMSNVNENAGVFALALEKVDAIWQEHVEWSRKHMLQANNHWHAAERNEEQFKTISAFMKDNSESHRAIASILFRLLPATKKGRPRKYNIKSVSH